MVQFLRKANQYLLRHPVLRQMLISLSMRLRLYRVLKKVINYLRARFKRQGELGVNRTDSLFLNLNPRAQQIYLELKRLRSQKKGE